MKNLCLMIFLFLSSLIVNAQNYNLYDVYNTFERNGRLTTKIKYKPINFDSFKYKNRNKIDDNLNQFFTSYNILVNELNEGKVTEKDRKELVVLFSTKIKYLNFDAYLVDNEDEFVKKLNDDLKGSKNIKEFMNSLITISKNTMKYSEREYLYFIYNIAYIIDNNPINVNQRNMVRCAMAVLAGAGGGALAGGSLGPLGAAAGGIVGALGGAAATDDCWNKAIPKTPVRNLKN